MFDDASRIEPLGQGRYRAEADDTWLQGRGQYGGLVAAWLVRAFEHASDDADRPVRSATFHLAAPVPPGPVDVEVDVVRRGAHVTQVVGRIVAGGDVVVSAVATLAGARTEAWVHAPSPVLDVPPPDAVPPVPWMPMMPAFARHVEYRFCLGTPPYAGGPVPELGGWGRFRDGATPDRAMLAALLDAWAPAPLATFDRPRPVATVDWTLHLLAPLAPDTTRDASYLSRNVCTWAADGYAEEVGEIRDRSGRLLGRMRQLVALLPSRVG